MVAHINTGSGTDFFVSVQPEWKDQPMNGIEQNSQKIHEVHDVPSLLVGRKEQPALPLMFFQFFVACGFRVLLFLHTARLRFTDFIGRMLLTHQIFSCIFRLCR